GEAVDLPGIFASEATRGDRPVNVLYIGVQATQFALAFGSSLAERGHRPRFYDFKKIKLGGGAGLWPRDYAKLFDPRLDGGHVRSCIGKAAIASRRLWMRWWRHKQRERKGAWQDDSDKSKKPAKKELKHGMSSDRYISWSVGMQKWFKRAAMKPEGPLAG